MFKMVCLSRKMYMKKIYHKNLSKDKWFEMTLAEQMANIGSEYFRAKNWKQKDNKKYFEPAFDRMLELLNLSLSDKRWKSSQLKELARLKEFVVRYLFNEESFRNDKDFDSYFMQFSLLARSNR